MGFEFPMWFLEQVLGFGLMIISAEMREYRSKQLQDESVK
jgi:hypothetical protein